MEKGQTGNTIEMDERFIEAENYHKMKQGQKLSAKKNDKYAKAMYEENQFDDDDDKLAVEKEPMESLLGQWQDPKYISQASAKKRVPPQQRDSR